MANTTSLTTEKKFFWGGGRSPFSVSYGKLMMWIFLLSDAFTFSSLLVSYGFIRFTYLPPLANEIVKPMDHLQDNFVEQMQEAKMFVLDHWPAPELVFNHFPFLHGIHLPLFFVSLMTFILIASSVTMVLAVEAGHRMAKKEVANYMVLTIIGGAMFLGCQAWEWTQFIHEGARLEMVEKVGLYWHFVDLVWVFVFTFFYLI
jgi:cytochrome c oxidase subunit 3